MSALQRRGSTGLRQLVCPAARRGAAVIAALWGCTGAAAAQVPVTLELPPQLHSEPGTSPRLDVKVSPGAVLPPNTFVRIKGLPPAIEPSEGHQIVAGSWAVPLDGLANLRLKVPGGVEARSDITVTLVSIDGRVLAEQRSMLIVTPVRFVSPQLEPSSVGPLLKTPVRAATPVPGPAVSVAARVMSEDARAEAQRMHERALAQLSSGAIAAARGLLERASDLGSADAAMVLAGTFDAQELARLGVVGVQPDAGLARQWYMRAQALGSGGAAERLARLR